jgi:tRNA (cytidine/uridine-2'-O-)-methyltransferase
MRHPGVGKSRVFHIVFLEPEIPGNTGNAIRMVAGTGCSLHLVGPLGFSVDDARLRRAGLDYHELAALHVHASLADAWQSLMPQRVFAFTSSADLPYTSISYRPGDILLFGRESTGLPGQVLGSDWISERVRIPMLPGIRSLNLANSAAVAVYEAWRQQDFRTP